jgi:hypothetical protein
LTLRVFTIFPEVMPLTNETATVKLLQRKLVIRVLNLVSKLPAEGK